MGDGPLSLCLLFLRVAGRLFSSLHASASLRSGESWREREVVYEASLRMEQKKAQTRTHHGFDTQSLPARMTAFFGTENRIERPFHL